MELLRFDHVQLTIPEGQEEMAREFYREVLMMKEIPKPESLPNRQGCWFRSGEVEIHIGVEETGSEDSKRHPALVVDELGKWRQRMEQLGVRTKDDAPIPGRIRFSIYDPFGNRIELLEYL